MTEHRCTFQVDVTSLGSEEPEYLTVTEWREGKAKDCVRCKANRQPRPVKRRRES